MKGVKEPFKEFNTSPTTHRFDGRLSSAAVSSSRRMLCQLQMSLFVPVGSLSESEDATLRTRRSFPNARVPLIGLSGPSVVLCQNRISVGRWHQGSVLVAADC